MEDAVLNKSLEESKELQVRWNQFREYIRVAIERGSVTAQAEMKFLELKSIIAMLHDGFLAKLDHDQKIGQNIMAIVGDCILLRRAANFSDAERQKFDFDWNECYLLICEQVQAMENEKQRLAGISERAFKASKRREAFQAKMHIFLHSDGFRWALTTAGIGVAVFVVPIFWSYRNLAKIPGVNKAYFFVADGFFRQYINPEYDYDFLSDVPPRTMGNHPNADSIDASGLTKAYFKSSVLNELGMTAQGAEEASKIVDATTEYQVENYSVQGQSAQFFYLFFPPGSRDKAKRFCQLVNDGIQALSDASQRAAIKEKTYLVRSANFIAIGIGRTPFRTKHILEDKYDIKDRNEVQ